jgi:predicted ATP-grasp superfamily ATP-dependent carboligase
METATAFVMTHESNPQRTSKTNSMIALAITRSLGRKGQKVVRVHPTLLDHSLSSRYCTAVEVCPNFYESESALVEFLLDIAKRYDGKKVLIPASDDCAYFLGKHQERLRPTYAMPVARPEVMERMIDKRKQYEDAQRFGIPVPETYFPQSQCEVNALAKELRGYPYVIKPTVAHKWRLASMKDVSKGRKAIVIQNSEDLLREYRGIGENDQSVMVQEIVTGADDELYTFLSYCTNDSVPKAYCIRKKIRQNPIDFGYCTSTISCHDDVVVEQSIKLLRGIGYQGISGIEYKHDPKTGDYKLIEINARAVNTIGIAAACGVDLPYIAFRDQVDRKVDPVTTWEEGVTWIWLREDLSAALKLRRLGRLTIKEWLRSIRGKRVHANFAGDDLRPAIELYLADVRMTLWRRLTRAN